MEILNPNLVCRLCTCSLLEFPECYSIDEEMENLIFTLTSILFDDVEDKENNLIMCVACYGRLKAFESYRSKCIKNQEKFLVKHQEDFEDPVDEDEDMEYVEYIELEEYEDSQDVHEKQEPDDEVTVAVEQILNDQQKSIKTEPTSKGKEIYQKLLVQCELCMKMIEKNRMEGHINKHNNYRPFDCPQCNKSFYCRQLLRLHRTSMHTNLKIKCETCDKSFPSQRALYAHSLRHKNRDKYKCELCEKKFNNTNSLKRHQVVHSGVRDYICGTCGVGFYRKFNLDTHIKNVHEEIKSFVCSYEGCDKKFGYARLLRDHHKKHHSEDEF